MAENKKRAGHIILSAAGIALCVVFGFMLLCNLTIIIKGTISPEKPPSVLGTTPMVVKSGSMSGSAPDHIEVGDLIFVSPVKAEDLRVGDVISFMESGSVSVVTHRIIEITEGALSFKTKGDANNAEDSERVTPDRIVGIYKGRIPKVGDFAIFLQTPFGMIVFIGIPLLAFIIYDIIRRQKYAARENKKTAALEAELERLRSAQTEPQKEARDNDADSGNSAPEEQTAEK